jgi:hypothetical protein
VISRTLDLPDFHVFHRNHANFPWRSHADWFLKQMVRGARFRPRIDIEATSDRVYRTDLFRAAANEMGVACPARSPAAGGTASRWCLPSSRSARISSPFTFGRLSHEQVWTPPVLKGATATAALLAPPARLPSGAFAQGKGSKPTR